VPAFFAVAIVVQNIVMHGRTGPGHAAGHLASATAVFPMTAVLAVIVWAAPRAWRRPELWLAAAVFVGGLLMSTVGNLRVVDSIGASNWTDDQASALGAARPGFESGHDLVDSSFLFISAGAVALAVLLLVRRYVSLRAGLGSTVLSVLFPPWILPGAGVIVLAIALCLSSRRSSSTGVSPTGSSAAPSPASTPPTPGS
jgi:hypothetical protein